MTSELRLRSVGRWVCAVAALLVGGCAADPAADVPREYLDETTAATVTVEGPPLVFALERPELAVNARDYLTLIPVDVNRSGVHVQYFFGYAWSTIDKRGVEQGGESLRFELFADGRRIPLAAVSGSARDIGLGEPPLAPPAASAVVLVSATSRDVQHFVLNATEVVAIAVRDGVSEPFALWSR